LQMGRIGSDGRNSPAAGIALTRGYTDICMMSL